MRGDTAMSEARTAAFAAHAATRDANKVQLAPPPVPPVTLQQRPTLLVMLFTSLLTLLKLPLTPPAPLMPAPTPPTNVIGNSTTCLI